MNTKYIYNAQVVTVNGIIYDGVIVIENQTIVQFGKEKDIQIPIGATKIDAKGAYVGPGFVDIHVHGNNGYETCFDTVNASNFFLQHGTTSFLATNLYTWPLDKQLSAIESVKRNMAEAKTVKGMYFEGPFMNPKYGCDAFNNPWGMETKEQDYKPIVDSAGGLAKVWAVAPERNNIIEFLRYARKVNPSVKFAVGHSEALPKEISDLGLYKPTIQTHAFNATGRKEEDTGIRAMGPDEYCIADKDIYSELICDSCAIHVHPEMQKLLLHCKGVEKVMLITDSTNFAGKNPPEFAHVTDLCFDEMGGLAGSKMTMEQACKNIMQHTNCGIAQAFMMASTNPAKAIGLYDVGEIFKGKTADLVFVDDKFNIKQVMLKGELCF